jgi:hypothetical protein
MKSIAVDDREGKATTRRVLRRAPAPAPPLEDELHRVSEHQERQRMIRSRFRLISAKKTRLASRAGGPSRQEVLGAP